MSRNQKTDKLKKSSIRKSAGDEELRWFRKGKTFEFH